MKTKSIELQVSGFLPRILVIGVQTRSLRVVFMKSQHGKAFYTCVASGDRNGDGIPIWKPSSNRASSEVLEDIEEIEIKSLQQPQSGIEHFLSQKISR